MVEEYPILVEYVWLTGNSGCEMRSKYRIIQNENQSTIWNYDGSSTGQATTENSEILLYPVCKFVNPFIAKSFIYLCDTYQRDTSGHIIPTASNARASLKIRSITSQEQHKPWFGIEQEYFIMANKGTHYSNTLPFLNVNVTVTDLNSQGQYYCAVGSQNIMYRELVEEHMRLCLLAGIKISGANAEVAPNQWEFQVGPCETVEVGDHLWIARYILVRLAEKYSVNIDFNPKPIDGDWNGSGLHTNFSDIATRSLCGIEKIHEYIEKLAMTHSEHINVYGTNTKRLTGKHETSSVDVFTSGTGSRNTSVRIPNDVASEKRGYFEDRRPASDADPYLVCSAIITTLYG